MSEELLSPKQKTKKMLEDTYNLIKDECPPTEAMDAHLIVIYFVNEIVQQWEYIDTYLGNNGGKFNPNLQYWLDVKNEVGIFDIASLWRTGA